MSSAAEQKIKLGKITHFNPRFTPNSPDPLKQTEKVEKKRKEMLVRSPIFHSPFPLPQTDPRISFRKRLQLRKML
jgi:hypothetical protein